MGAWSLRQVTEHVEIPAFVYGGDFDAANRLHAQFMRRCTNVRDGRRGVVIGHGHHGDTRSSRALDKLPRRAAAVRGGGMEMEPRYPR